MTKARSLRLKCPCGRNLADVTHPTYGDGSPSNPDWTHDGLMVTPRPNVDQNDWRPWHEGNKRRPRNPMPPTMRAESLNRQIEDVRRGRQGLPPLPKLPDWDDGGWEPVRPDLVDADWHDRTYTWHCKCGLTHSRRHERISGAWLKWITGDTPSNAVVLGGAM